MPLTRPSPSPTTVSYTTARSSIWATSDTAAPATSSKSCCGPVSSSGSTTHRLDRGQLNQGDQRETITSASLQLSHQDILAESNILSEDTSTQDFDFDDIFDYGHAEYSAICWDDNCPRVSAARPRTQTDFSFSHYAGHLKGAGHVKMTKSKSGQLRPRVARMKSGCRKACCHQFQDPPT